MSKILITGNGFDLFHGLPTKYGHFMAVMKTIEKYDFGKEIRFEDLFGSHFKTQFDKEYDLILKNYNTENIVFDKARIKVLEDKLKSNNWYCYFRTALEIETWIDFENEINIALSEISEIIYSERNTYFEAFQECQKHSLLFFFNLFDKTKASESRINKSYSILEKGKTGLYKKEKINGKKLFEDLSKSLDDFIIIFNRYFVDVIEEFYKNIKVSHSIPLEQIDLIYTFNYTPTIEKIYKLVKPKVNYLHGKIDASDLKQNLVLGVEDISNELKTHKIYSFTKSYQKIKKDANCEFIEFPSANKSAPSETIFYIIGHSLDSSDKEYIEDVFKFLELDLTEASQIVVFYHNDDDFDSKLKNLYSIIEKRVIVHMNKCKRLRFVELTINNIKSEMNKKLYNRYAEYDIR
ncbi:AbiH family protein [Flavobacterium mekongense]|uniref:AbiH family protein n=1 Tax=Flavobacterium mekongense TaxID=3379707 RepID=UPI00399BD9AB